MAKVILVLGSFILVMVVSACNSGATPPPASTPVLSDIATPATSTPVPATPTPVPATPTSVPATATPLPASPTPAPDTSALAGQLLAQLYPGATPPPDSSPAIQGVSVIPLKTKAAQPPLWVAYTYGLRNFETEQQHFVAVYTYNNNWQAVAKIELDDADYVDEASVLQTMLEPEHVWLELHAGVGAHSGTYHLLQFDGQDLNIALSSFSPSPGAGSTNDLNGDGQLEVVLNTTDPYVFCYACGVRVPGFEVWQWNGSDLARVDLSLLPDTAPADGREANNQAVMLAQAGLWQDAQTAINEAQNLEPANDTVSWNEILISLHTEALVEQIKTGSGFPLLAHVFYGDYAGALDELRGYAAAEIFSVPSPVLEGTPASGWEDTLSEWLINRTTTALAVQPNLAAAYFLRGWGYYLINPADPQVVAELEQAVQLEPDEPLYTDSLAYLQ